MNVSLKRAVCTVATSAVVASGLTLSAGGTAAADPGRHAGPTAQAPAAPGGVADSLLVVEQATQILGSGNVGSTLTRRLPVWDIIQVLPILNVLDVQNETQWLADGVPISGATGDTFVPSIDQAGQEIRALVTGKLLGLLPVESLSNAIPIVGGGGDGGGGTGGGTGDPGDQVLELLSSLQLLGTPNVDSLLSIAQPLWSLPGVSTAYQWFRDNVPIPGATGSTYIPSLEDAGHEVYARITGTLEGLPVVNMLTDRLTIPAAQLEATSKPRITGTPTVGSPLQMQAPTWDPADAQVSAVQWLRDGTPVPGATSATYTPVADDLGHRLTVQVTGHKEGYTDQTVTSDPVTVVAGDALTPTMRPTLSGRPSVGDVLTVDPGTWSSEQVPDFSYQWNRDGRPIPAATSAFYLVRPEDAGHQLSATVTAERTGYQPGTSTTQSMAVAQVETRTTTKVAKKRARHGKRARLVVTVHAGQVEPGGTVAVRDGKRTLRTLTLSPNGKATTKLPKLKPGKHKLRAVYSGDGATTASSSRVTKLKVLKHKGKKGHKKHHHRH